VNYLVVVGFPPPVAVAGAARVETYLGANHVGFRPVGFGAWMLTAAPGANAQAIGDAIGRACLSPGDHIAVAEWTANSWEG
jgi:hypothetical protein